MAVSDVAAAGVDPASLTGIASFDPRHAGLERENPGDSPGFSSPRGLEAGTCHGSTAPARIP
jgi:hypothetical protein